MTRAARLAAYTAATGLHQLGQCPWEPQASSPGLSGPNSFSSRYLHAGFHCLKI